MTKTTLKKGLKQAFIVLGLSSVLLVVFAAIGGTAGAQLIQPGDAPSTIAGATGGEGSIRALALRIVDFFLLFLGLIAVIMIIYGGINYVTAAGNQEKIDRFADNLPDGIW